MKRKICVVVTARPSYSRIQTVLSAIREHPDLELQLVVAATALLEKYGSVVPDMEKEGFPVYARVYNQVEGSLPAQAVKTTGLGLIELPAILNDARPHMVVTIGDRFETLSTAIAAAYMNIPLVHIQGGEVTGSIDEKVRHAITKLADLHLVASESARTRLIRMGEDPATVFHTGCPSIDLAARLIQAPDPDFDPFQYYQGVGKRFSFPTGYLVVLQHAVPTEYTHARAHIEITLQAILETNIPTCWFWPNGDAGADDTARGIRSFREKYPGSTIHFFKNMAPLHFLKLLKNAACLVGNSSAGIRECAFLGIPAVNIGTRQQGRERARNVIDTEYDQAAISKALITQLAHGKYPQDTLYGNGDSGRKIAGILATVPLSFVKQLTY